MRRRRRREEDDDTIFWRKPQPLPWLLNYLNDV